MPGAASDCSFCLSEAEPPPLLCHVVFVSVQHHLGSRVRSPARSRPRTPAPAHGRRAGHESVIWAATRPWGVFLEARLWCWNQRAVLRAAPLGLGLLPKGNELIAVMMIMVMVIIMMVIRKMIVITIRIMIMITMMIISNSVVANVALKGFPVKAFPRPGPAEAASRSRRTERPPPRPSWSCPLPPPAGACGLVSCQPPAPTCPSPSAACLPDAAASSAAADRALGQRGPRCLGADASRQARLSSAAAGGSRGLFRRGGEGAVPPGKDEAGSRRAAAAAVGARSLPTPRVCLCVFFFLRIIIRKGRLPLTKELG